MKKQEHKTKSQARKQRTKNKSSQWTIPITKPVHLQRTRAKNQHGQRITSSRNKLKGQRTRTQLVTTTQDRRTTSTTKNAFTNKEQKQETHNKR